MELQVISLGFVPKRLEVPVSQLSGSKGDQFLITVYNQGN
jgi:hypothetical protein